MTKKTEEKKAEENKTPALSKRKRAGFNWIDPRPSTGQNPVTRGKRGGDK